MGMGDALYLHYEPLARGALHEGDATRVAVVPFRDARVAVVFRSKTEPSSARIAIVQTATRERGSSPVLTPLEGAHDDASGAESLWGGAWSPDGRVLVVYGLSASGGDGKRDAAVWVVTQSEWIDDEPVSASRATETAPLVVRVSPRRLLASDAPWRASASAKRDTSAIVSAFFAAKSTSRCFLVTQDGWLLRMDIQVASLLVVARSRGRVGDDVTSFVKMASSTRLTNWHAGVTAVAYEPSSSTLVISGGLKNPSAELREQGASSLSVWTVTSEDPYVELLDYTMVMGSAERTQDAEEKDDQGTEIKADGIMTKMRHSFLNPLKMLHGDDDDNAPTLPGTITHLGISPDGVFLSLVNQDGQFRIRQIDACADVAPWQFVQSDRSNEESGVTMTAWLSPSTIGFLTHDHQVVSGFLASSESHENIVDDEEQGSQDNGVSQSSTTVQVVMQKVVIDEFAATSEYCSMRWLSSWVSTTDDESTESNGFVLHDVKILKSGESTMWQVSRGESVSKIQLVQLLVDAQQLERALELIDTGNEGGGDSVDLDAVFQRLWVQYRTATTAESVVPGIAVLSTNVTLHGLDFEKALTCLNAIKSDKQWAIKECLRVVVSDSLFEMKEILATALRALMDIHPNGDHEEQLAHDRATLLRYLYRLDTLNQLIFAELDEEERRVLAEEQCFDGAVFVTFRDAPIVDVARGFAKEGRLEALSVLFRRNGFNLLPHRTDILDLLPPTLPPQSYAHLLPAIGPHSDDEWQFYTLAPNGSIGYCISEVELLSENRTHDLTADEATAFEACARKAANDRRDEYALWFTHRMVELDSMYGQLGNAFELGQCGYTCLLEAVSDLDGESELQAMNAVASTPFEEFLQHSDRLFKCVHSLNVPGCVETSLEDWSLLSLHDQIMAVVIEDTYESKSTVEELLRRLRLIFLEQRRHAYSLDELVSWLCQVLLSTRNGSVQRNSVRTLELCAQLIHESNPANPTELRWIQDDARLLRTAIDVIYSASVPDASRTGGHEADTETSRQAHQQFVDALWLIFQSLPERKPNDPPILEQLQVEVDGMEDLLIAMDVLANYGIRTSPAEIRQGVVCEEPELESVAESPFALKLVDEMCAFGLLHGIPWTSVWQDALKVKSHVFGERVTQEAMLSVLLRQLLALYRLDEAEQGSKYLADSHDLIANWVAANTSALRIPMDILLVTIRDRIDQGSDEEASHLVAMAKSILALPAVASTEEAQPVAAKFQSIMTQEQNHMKIRELLELLTYGALKVTRTQLRELHNEKDRTDLVLQIYTSNPSNYKMSAKAQTWLSQELSLPSSEPLDVVLDGVLHLTSLFRIHPAHRVRIVLKAAYSALYCLDYDTAHRLASKVVSEWSGAKPEASSGASLVDDEDQTETTTLLLSLVLDLVSSSSFRSWSKKVGLVKSLLAVDSSLMWGHPVADLLFEHLHKLEAIQALSQELGLSEHDLENRREQEQRRKLSAEEALLKELEIVVDLLNEEGGQKRKDDRDFVLRLLQKGFQLFMVVQTQTRTPLAPPSPTARTRSRSYSYAESESEKDKWMIRVVSQMGVLGFQEAHSRLVQRDDDWELAMEAGLSYLLLLSYIGGSSDELSRVWRDEILPMCSRSSKESDSTSIHSSDEAFVHAFTMFFQFLAASTCATASVTDLSSLRVLMDKLKHSSRSTQDFIYSQPEHEEDEFDVDAEDRADQAVGVSELGKSTYLLLAKQCQDLLHSQKESQELEAVSSFLNDDVDLERFSVDVDYRLETIRRMSTRRDHLPVAKEFASKYGIDEYECVLAYIRHAFFPDDVTSSSTTRQEQLEQAFRGSDDGGGDDFLEQALQRPVAFGEFLLRPGSGVFESLSGTDHVGILLVLRMILECSKRTAQDQDPSNGEARSLLPLSKSSSDRVTLLFMCLKRLKEISSTSGVQHTPDFKLVCGSQSAHDLLHGVVNADESRAIATAAIAPFLTSKNIKMLTKVLQKLHQMSPSAIVMVYLDDMLSKIWHEHDTRGSAPNADLAAYAFESCMPFLSVLTIDHLLIFHTRFVLSDASEDVSSQFYGQQLIEMARFGALLSWQKRLEVISDTFGLFQSRIDALKTSTEDMVEQRAGQLRSLEEQLVEAAFWFVVDKVSQDGLSESDDSAWLVDWKKRVSDWFAADSAAKAQQEDQILNAFVVFCERAKSLDLATLPVELALGLTSPPDFVSRAVQDIYCKGVSDVIHKALTGDGSEGLADEVVAHWASKLVPSPSEEVPHASLRDLAQYIAALEPQSRTASNASMISDDVYRNVVGQLESTTSPIVRAVVEKRKAKLASTGDDVSSLRAAVISQWKAVISQYEEQHSWMTSALLSHVLTLDHTATFEDRQYDFGLRVKAVCEWLRDHHHQDSWGDIFEVPTSDLYPQFEERVFTKVLTIVESCNTQSAQSQAAHQVTVSLAIMLRWFEELSGAYSHGVAANAWKHEKEKALMHRLGDDPSPCASENGEADASSTIHLWERLLLRGSWDERLMQWYTFVAYDRIKSPAVVEECVATRADENPALTVMLLLVCPFEELREQHQAHILATSRTQLLAPSLSQPTKTRLLELLLLRLDLQVLLGVEGVEAVLLAFYIEQNRSIIKRKSLSWTSSVEYYVCQLVRLREYAAASRLVCALWNVHPMLRDLENARLVLGNYLAALAKATSSTLQPMGVEGAVTKARAQAYEHYKRELI